MSLINDALKQARNQQPGRSKNQDDPSQGSPLTSEDGSPPPTRNQPPKRGRRPLTQTIVFLALIGTGAWILFSPTSKDQEATDSTRQPTSHNGIRIDEARSTSSLPSSSPKKENTRDSGITLTQAPKPTPAKKAPSAAKGMVKASAKTLKGQGVTVTSVSEGNPEIIAFLNSSQISAARVARSNSRVFMNGQVYFVDSVVNPNLQLRLISVQPETIIFNDGSGLEYKKRF